MARRTPDRRDLLRGAAAGAAFAGLRTAGARGGLPRQARAGGLGDLVPDPAGVLDLPEGFRYVELSRTGDEMDDGLLVPPGHDGMAAFAGADGRTVLVRNHELGFGVPGAFGPEGERLDRFPGERLYDAGADQGPPSGGTVTLVVETGELTLEHHALSLAGTVWNCAGGPTPWGSWLTCEETTQRAGGPAGQDHGWVFEVPARPEEGPVEPVPLTALGRFRHEAAAVDATTGVVYLTEDRYRGLLYRLVPTRPGHLREGGRLQALGVAGAPSLDTRNWHRFSDVPAGEPLAVTWVDLEDTHAPDDDLRFRGFFAGAAWFARGEGIWAADDGVYVACTAGGRSHKGQVWRYVPSPAEGTEGEVDAPGTLELWLEPDDAGVLDNCDNIATAPWGDLLVCEDGPGHDRLLGVTPEGEVYPVARHVADQGELAGACFSPDGSTLFVNAQARGTTFAIQGPWERARSG